jgi:tetratricopeptide (TPR) repeat protein
MNAEALKEQARRHEQREEWLKAIELYSQAVDRLVRDDQPDIALYNRLGDLEIRVGNIERAVEHYEQAIDLYVESELPNNAIAICRKVVRNLPTRHHIFFERMQKAEDMEEAFRALIEFVDVAPEDLAARGALAAQLEAHERTSEAVEQYIAMHQRMVVQGREEEAAQIEEKISELDPAMLIPPPGAPQAEPAGAQEPEDLMGFETTALVENFPTLETAAVEEPEAETDSGGFEIGPSLDTEEVEAVEEEAPSGFAFEGAARAAADEDATDEDVSGEDVGDESEPEWATTADFTSPEDEPAEEEGDRFEPEHVDVDALASLSGMEVEVAPGVAGAREDEELAEEEAPFPYLTFDDEKDDALGDEEEVLGPADFGVRDDGDRGDEYVGVAEDVPDLEVAIGAIADLEEEPGKAAEAEETPAALEAEGEAPADDGHDADLVAALQARLEDDPEDGDTWLALAQEFLSSDRGSESSMALEQALSRFSAADDLDGLIRATKTVIGHEPDRVEHRQRLVELAIRKNDPAFLTPSYLDLAECLLRGGDQDRARAVFQQVLVADPENQAAVEGLAGLEGAPAAPAQEVASSEDYIDLGSLVLDEADEKTTRWKVAAEEPSGDEEADFAKMLTQFKEKVAENVEADDLGAHYDLGTAYKEMGLVDEAIAEFQQALRAEPEHLPTHEMLGQCFMEKGQFEVAVRSMNRALDSASEVEDELLGIYYQMARAQEELGNKGEALEFYEKVFALDINFQDVTERLRELR